MKNLLNYGRVFYGVGIAGVAVVHFYNQGYNQVIYPLPAHATHGNPFLVSVVALYLLVTGLLLAMGKYVKLVSLLLAYILLAFLVFAHLPAYLNFEGAGNPFYVNYFKMLALTGGAFAISEAYGSDRSSKFFERSQRIAVAGKYLFAIMVIRFGIGHLFLAKYLGEIFVPRWMGFPGFWSFITGIALIGTGLSILINFKVKLINQLAGVMLLSWLLLVHIPFAIKYPEWQQGENFNGIFTCLAFSGIAFVIAMNANRKMEGSIAEPA